MVPLEILLVGMELVLQVPKVVQQVFLLVELAGSKNEVSLEFRLYCWNLCTYELREEARETALTARRWACSCKPDLKGLLSWKSSIFAWLVRRRVV